MDIRAFRKILFPLSCLLLVVFSFSLDAFKTDFSIATLFALFILLVIELLLVVFKKHNELWNRVKWLVLAGIILLTLISTL